MCAHTALSSVSTQRAYVGASPAATHARTTPQARVPVFKRRAILLPCARKAARRSTLRAVIALPRAPAHRTTRYSARRVRKWGCNARGRTGHRQNLLQPALHVAVDCDGSLVLVARLRAHRPHPRAGQAPFPVSNTQSYQAVARPGNRRCSATLYSLSMNGVGLCSAS